MNTMTNISAPLDGTQHPAPPPPPIRVISSYQDGKRLVSGPLCRMTRFSRVTRRNPDRREAVMCPRCALRQTA